MKVSGVLIDVSKDRGRILKTEVEDSLDELYKILNCSTIDIVSRTINGKMFDIVCDDEALLKDDQRPSAIRKDGIIMLHGNLFICNHYKSSLASLSKDDTDFIMENIAMVSYKLPSRPIYTNPILLNVDYV